MTPCIVFFRARPGFFIGGAIAFGPGIFVKAFVPWGWGGIGFGCGNTGQRRAWKIVTASEDSRGRVNCKARDK
jgi:hypothetical protein